MKRGLFVSFEGPEGSGKSTIIKMVYEKLAQLFPQHKTILTREPGGNNNVIAEQIRQIILQKTIQQIAPKTEVLLFAASRAQHVHDLILPNLEQGNIVLCDRFIHSSIAYQGYARGIDVDKIWEISMFATNNVQPDLSFFLMIPPKEGLKRINANMLREINRIDSEDISIHEKVYDGYKNILKQKKSSYIQIDANQPVDIVFKNVMLHLEKAIKKHYGRDKAS
ncbi:MAG: dTMP kinase [Mycoplasmataceae bacterium]|nr:dTMP kinase [Mycoplasmataceae bacterium]